MVRHHRLFSYQASQRNVVMSSTPHWRIGELLLRRIAERVILRSALHTFALVWLIACVEGPSEVPSPIDVSFETEDVELRQFIGDMYTRADRDRHSALHRGRLGMVYDANGFTEAAAETYKQARALDADDVRWPYLESLALSGQGRIEDAINVMGLAIQLDASYLPARLAKGYWLIDLGEFESACETFKRAKTDSDGAPQSVALTLGLAQCQLELGDTEKATRTLDTLPTSGLPAYAEFIKARVNRASEGLISDQSEWTELGDIGQMSWADPIAGTVVEYTRGLSNEALLAQRLIDGGRAADALQLIESLRERHPDVVHLIELRSAALISLGRRTEAISALRDGLRKFPEEHLLHFNLGMLLDSIGQIDVALKQYDQAITYQEDFLPAYDRKAKLLIRQGLNERARDVLIASLAYRPPDPATFNLLGVLYGGLGDWERSVEYLTKAKRLEPENVNVLVSLALSLSELQRYEDALNIIERAKILDPQNPKLDRAVMTLISNGVLSAETLKFADGQGSRQ